MPPSLSAEESLGRLEPLALQAEACGVKRTSGVARCDTYAGQRFLRWAEVHGFDLEDAAQLGPSGWRVLPAGVVVPYLVQIARPTVLNRQSWRLQVQALSRELRTFRLACPGVTDDTDPAVVQLLNAVASHLDSTDRRPAKPVLIGDLLEIDVAFDAVTHPVFRAALRAFQRVAFYFGGRITETLCRLRWRDVVIEDESLTVTWPAGCKHQPEAIAMQRATGNPACPAEALLELRAQLVAAGLDPGPEDYIFPEVTGSGETIMNPAVKRAADTTWQAQVLDSVSRRGLADAAVVADYRRVWTSVASGTSFGDSIGHRRVSPHGLRRGTATALAIGGMPAWQIQVEMRHGSPEMTLRYVDGTSMPLAALSQLLGEQASDEGAADVADILRWQGSDVGDDDGRCQVIDLDAIRCPLVATSHHLADIGYVCALHRQRARFGSPMHAPIPAAYLAGLDDDFDESGLEGAPDAPDVFGETCLPVLSWADGCVVSLDGTGAQCGRLVDLWSYVLDGNLAVFCGVHLQRFIAGEEAWARPVFQCGAIADGVPCGVAQGYLNRVEVLGLGEMRLCSRHYQRYRQAVATAARTTGPVDHVRWQAAVDRISPDAVCEASVDGPPCGRTREQSALVRVTLPDGHRLVVCGSHYDRVQRAMRETTESGCLDPSWAAPIIANKPITDDEPCVATDLGEVCGRTKSDGQMTRVVVGDVGMIVCGGHYQRFKRLSGGDGWQAPLRQRRAGRRSTVQVCRG